MYSERKSIKIYSLHLLRVFLSMVLKFVPYHGFRDLILWPLSKRLFGYTKYNEVVEIRKGLFMRVYGDMQDMVNKLLLFTSYYMPLAWEPGTARLVEKLSIKSKCSVVAGSHIGYYPLILSKGNSNTKIYAFEPNPVNFLRCKENVKLNNFTNIDVINSALGDSNKKLKMYFDDGQSSLLDTERKHEGEGLVDVVRLDDYLSTKAQGFFNNIDLILLDAEGYEPYIIDGAMNLMRTQKPNLICEINPKALKSAGSSTGEFCDKLTSLGYKLYKIEEGNHGVKYEPNMKVILLTYSADLFGNNSFSNLFATVNDSLLDELNVIVKEK